MNHTHTHETWRSLGECSQTRDETATRLHTGGQQNTCEWDCRLATWVKQVTPYQRGFVTPYQRGGPQNDRQVPDADRQGLVVECCFTATETVGLLGTGGQDGHHDFHTVPEL